MKIKNDYIIIKKGSKEIKLRNTILDTYIGKIINNQFIVSKDERARLNMVYAFLKFDNKLSFDKKSNLTDEDFDLGIHVYNKKEEIIDTKVIEQYSFTSEYTGYAIKEKNNEHDMFNLSKYVGKKITAIGFGTDYNPHLHNIGETDIRSTIYACIDVSNYNIYIENSDETLSIERKDVLSTDAIFYSPQNLIKGPLHLCNGQVIDYYTKYIGILKSVGLGITSSKINIEKELIPYSSHIDIKETNNIKINDIFTITDSSDGLFPLTNIFPSINLFPARIIKNPIYPSIDIYPGQQQYMLEAPYQYMQLKYKIYKYTDYGNDDYSGNEIKETNYYYILSKAIENKKRIKMNIKYES